jgi:hypothetical protein
MDFFKRILNSDKGTATLASFPIHFSNGKTALAVRVPQNADPQAVIAALSLDRPVPTIFVSGGARQMDTDSMSGTRSSIEDGLARFLNERHVTMIDGGTSSGVMLLVGLARARRNYTFPLVGITPDKWVTYPGSPNNDEFADLDAFHSHFVLTDGDHFGSESELILNLVTTLSGAKKCLVMIVNGGDIVKNEAHLCATRNPRLPMLVLEGSGRFADELAEARKSGSSDPLIRDILKLGMVHFIPVKAGPDTLYRWLQNFFGY